MCDVAGDDVCLAEKYEGDILCVTVSEVRFRDAADRLAATKVNKIKLWKGRVW